MNETPKSDLKIFTADLLVELAEGLGEMTGLDDQEVNKLLQKLPPVDGLVTVRNICALEPKVAKQNTLHLEFDYPDGKIYSIGKTLDGDEFFGVVSSREHEAIEDSMRYEPAKAAGSVLTADTSDVDEGWDK